MHMCLYLTWSRIHAVQIAITRLRVNNAFFNSTVLVEEVFPMLDFVVNSLFLPLLLFTFISPAAPLIRQESFSPAESIKQASRKDMEIWKNIPVT